jgi:hypothetical protein
MSGGGDDVEIGHGLCRGFELRADRGFGASALAHIAIDSAVEADLVGSIDVDAEVVEGAERRIVKRENTFDDEDFGWHDQFGVVGDAGVGAEVVYRAGDWLVAGECADMFDEQVVLKRVGVIEVLQGAVGGWKVAKIPVVEVEREKSGVELSGELVGEGGLAGAGASGDTEDEGTAGKRELFRNRFSHGYDLILPEP